MPAMTVESTIYVDGRSTGSVPLKSARETARKRGGFAWVSLAEPTREEFDSVADEFGLPVRAKDSMSLRMRPRIERYGEKLFAALETARYVDEAETVEFGEARMVVGPDFIITIRRGEASEFLAQLRRKMEGDPGALHRGPFAVLRAVMDGIVDEYMPVVEGLENDVDEIEGEVFGGNPDVSRRIYALSREVIGFHHAVHPLPGALERLIMSQDTDPEARRYLRNLQERVLRVTEQAEGFRELLSNILSVNLTMVSVRQNTQVQKISAWAAILVVPTIITGIYGMNFHYMPELHWTFGYPYALILMVVLCVLLYLGFKRSGWL